MIQACVLDPLQFYFLRSFKLSTLPVVFDLVWFGHSTNI